MAEQRGKSHSSSAMSRKRSFAKANERTDSPSDSTTCSDFGDIGTSDSTTMKRERNRQIAKNNRERKKEEARELQENVLILKRKIQSLQNELALRPSFLANDNHLTISYDMEFTSKILSVLEQLRNRSGSESTAFFVVNAASHFFPIVCASPALSELTGYSMQEIIGQNCGFLSGLQTSRNERERLNYALQQGQDISATLLNYRKDGSTFWNNVHFANLSTVLQDGELAPYVIVGLHTEVFSRQGTLVDCAASDNGGSENGHSPRSQQSHHGAHASGTFGGASGAQQSSGSSNNNTAAAAGGEGGGGVSANMQNHLGELDAVSCSPDDDDHTILQEILSTHQMQVLNTANAGKTGKSKRARSDISCTAAASSAEAGPSSGLLDHFLGMPLQGVPHVANHIFATQHGDRTAQVSAGAAEVPELQMLSLNHQSHQQRSNSVMSMLTTDGTDASDIASSPAATTPQGITTVVAKAAEVPMSTSANMECEQTPAALHYPPAPAVAVRSDSFHSLSMSSAAIVGSPVRATAALVPASRLPSGDHRHYPAIQGLPQSVLRSMSGSAFNSPAGSREVPPFIPSGMKSAPQNVTTSVTQSVRRIGVPGRSPAASPSATDLRRSYYSALENHFATESAAGAMEISMTETTTGTCADPARDEAFSSPMRQPVPCGSAFTPPFANSAFQQTVGKSASSTGTTTEEALSVATDESLAHNAVTLLPIVTATDEGAGCNKSSPRGGTPKRVSFTHSKAADSPISCFELLYSHKYAPAGIHPDSAPTSGSGSSADGGRLRATSDAASLDIAERLALDEQQHDLDQEDQDCMAATAAQVRFATATATANAATASEKDASSVCATPQQVTTGRSIMTRLSTPRFF